MRKPNLIIGKKHIILACLTLILGVAVYMNYAFASVEDDITAEKTMADASDSSVPRERTITSLRYVSPE